MGRARQTTSSDAPGWWTIAAMGAVCLLACAMAGLRLDLARAIVPVAGLALLVAAAAVGRTRGLTRWSAGAVAFLQMTIFTMIAVALSYALAASAGPLWDDRFATIDRALGFDWPATFLAADAAPTAVLIGGIAYHSLTVQMVACIVVLAAAGRIDRLRIAVAAAILAGFATVLVSGVTPAMGNVVDPAGYRHLWPSVAWTERSLIAGLRDGSGRTVDLMQLMGIVTFPSYHATLPVILAWAQRDVPWWRVIAPLWAGLTIVATPLFGGHYGVDVLAGLALAVVALAVAPTLVLRHHRAVAPGRRERIDAHSLAI